MWYSLRAMSRSLTKGLLLAVAFATALVASPAASKDAAMRSVRVKAANFRAGPSDNAKVIFTATRYFPVKILKNKKGWLQVVDFEGEKSWVAQYLLSTEDTVVVQVEEGNLRKGPGTQHELLEKVTYGEAFRVVKRKGRWLRIANKARVVGWIRDDLTWGD
jgi:SH3-like domain-containing protein